jgi:hypothetical protein
MIKDNAKLTFIMNSGISERLLLARAEMHEETQLTVRRFVRAMDSAEASIVGLMAREREALRSGNRNIAKEIHARLGKAAKLYLGTICDTRNTLAGMSDLFSDSEISEFLEQRRLTFASLLRIEMAALTAARLLANDRSSAAISQVA